MNKNKQIYLLSNSLLSKNISVFKDKFYNCTKKKHKQTLNKQSDCYENMLKWQSLIIFTR